MIDEKELRKEIYRNFDAICSGNSPVPNWKQHEILDGLDRIIDRQPIYDIGKVVEQLEKEYETASRYFDEECDLFYHGRATAMDYAIEIVRKGGAE